MSILSSILKQLGIGSAHADPQTSTEPTAAPPTGSTTSTTGTPAPAGTADVGATLDSLSKKHPGLNPRTSIVDLLKALDLGSTFEDRQKLAKEVGLDPYEGTAEQNTKLHEAVLKRASQ